MKLNRKQIDRALLIREHMPSALQRLADLDHTMKLKKYFNVPKQYVPSSSLFEDKTSSGLASCIIQWLTLCGHHPKRDGTYISVSINGKPFTLQTDMEQADTLHINVTTFADFLKLYESLTIKNG